LKDRVFYRGHMLGINPTPTDNGKFRSRVVIIAMGGERTRSQTFLDLEVFSEEGPAIERARQAGSEWVDAALLAAGDYEGLPPSTGFGAFPISSP
jgi:hypothetical protein